MTDRETKPGNREFDKRADALRRNLLRRKQQSRARQGEKQEKKGECP